MRQEYVLPFEIYEWFFERAFSFDPDRHQLSLNDDNSFNIPTKAGIELFYPDDWFGSLSNLIYHLQQHYKNLPPSITASRMENLCIAASTRISLVLHEMAGTNIADRVGHLPEHYEREAFIFLFQLYSALRTREYLVELAKDPLYVNDELLDHLHIGLNINDILDDDGDFIWRFDNSPVISWKECKGLQRVFKEQIKFLHIRKSKEKDFFHYMLSGSLAIETSQTEKRIMLSNKYDPHNPEHHQLIAMMIYLDLQPVNFMRYQFPSVGYQPPARV